MRAISPVVAVWLALAVVGCLLTWWTLVDAVLDRRALTRLADFIPDGPRDRVARSNIAIAGLHLLVELDFLAIGVAAFLVSPRDSPSRRAVVGAIIIDGLIAGAALLAAAAIVQRLYRRALLRALARLRKHRRGIE